MHSMGYHARPVASGRIAVVGQSDHAMVSRLCAELRRRGRDVTVVAPDHVAAAVRGGEVTVSPFYGQQPYAVVMVTISTDQVGALQGVSALEQTGVPVANTAASVMRAADKFVTAVVLARAGVRVPATVAVSSLSAATAQGDRLGYPLVLKAADGSEGSQVAMVADRSALAAEIVRIRASLGLAPSVNSSLIMQEVVGGGRSGDRRLFVVGGRVQAAMDRHPRPGEWRSNMSQGATPHAARPTAAEVWLAEKAADALGLAFGTIDLMTDESGPVVIEANSFGDILDVAMVSGLDLIGALADLAETKAGLRADTPIRSRPLGDQERSDLTDFCEDRLRRKLDQLDQLAAAELDCAVGG